MIGRVAGCDLVVKHEAVRSGDIAESVADISRARADLAYTPRVGVEDGLRRLLA